MKVLKTHEFTRKAIGSRTHDWDTLLDGQIRELKEGEDMGESKVSTFGNQFRQQARKRGLSAHIQTTEDGKGLIVQAIKDPNAGKNGAAKKGK